MRGVNSGPLPSLPFPSLPLPSPPFPSLPLPFPPTKTALTAFFAPGADFTENQKLFPDVTIPVLSVEARQFPVTVHFSRRTRVDQDPVAQVVRKVAQIHTRLPGGGILVFMTGQVRRC